MKHIAIPIEKAGLFASIFFILIASYLLNYFSVISSQFHDALDVYSLTELTLPTISSGWRGFFSPMIDRQGALYLSQFGLHGWSYQLIHYVLGLAPTETVALIRTVLTILFCATLSALLVSLRPVTGSTPIFLAGVGLALSPRLAQYAGDTYWFGVAFILPLLLSVLYVRANDKNLRRGFLFLLFLSSYLKLLCGYEFVTTFLIAPVIMMLTCIPLGCWTTWESLRRIVLVLSVLSAGFAAALASHIVQITTYTGNSPLVYLAERVKARSIGSSDREYIMVEVVPALRERAASLALPALGFDRETATRLAIRAFSGYPRAGVGVILMYFTYTMVSFGATASIYGFMLPFAGGIPFVLVLLASLMLLPLIFAACRLDRRYEPVLRVGLCAALGLIGPLSWYVFGFNHSVIHGFIAVTLLYFPWGVLSLLFLAQVMVAVAVSIGRTLTR